MRNKPWNITYLEVVLILRSSTDYLIQVLGSLLVVFGLVFTLFSGVW